VTPGKDEEIRAAVSTVPEPVTPLHPNTGHGQAAAGGRAEQAQLTFASQAERNTERSAVFLALETKFLRFETRQEQDAVLSWSTGHQASTASVFGSDSLDFSHAPGLDTGAGLGFPGRLRVLPAPEIPGTMSKPKGKPRKYQDGPSSCAGTRSREDGDSSRASLAGG
jgi:hypothetical protein